MNLKAGILLVTLASTAGCWNGDNIALRFGDISIGQQLIDLKRALDENVISDAEYEATRQALLRITAVCENQEEEGG
jgi:hypothetical protein